MLVTSLTVNPICVLEEASRELEAKGLAAGAPARARSSRPP